MIKMNRNILLAALAFFGLAGAGIGTGFAAWVYSDGSAAAQSANVSAGVGSWKYLPKDGMFYLMKSDGTVDWDTPVTPAVYSYPSSSDTTHICKVANPSGTNICAFYPTSYIPDGSTDPIYLVGTTRLYSYNSYTQSSSYSNVTQLVQPHYCQQIYLPMSYNSIGQYSFYKTTGLKEVHFYDASDYGATNATSVSIGTYAFSQNASLKTIDLPSNISSIDTNAFEGDTSLNNVVLPNAVTSISNYCFQDCSSLSSITLGNAVTSIGTNAFCDASSLINVTLPSSLTTTSTAIKDYAFACYYRYIPLFINYKGTRANWKKISSKAGYRWHLNRYLYVTCSDDANTSSVYGTKYFATDDNGNASAAYALDTTTGTVAVGTALAGDKNLTSIILGGLNTTISDNAFANNTKLQSVVFSGNVTSVGYGAFLNDTSLVSVSGSVTSDISFGSSAFQKCNAMTNFSLTSTGTISAGYHCFYNDTKLTGLTLKASNISINSSAAINCSVLTSVDITATNDITIGYQSFYSDLDIASVSLVCGGTLTVGTQAFCYDSSISTLTLAAGTANLGYQSFEYCYSLETIDLSKCHNLTVVTDCFYGANSLTAFYLGSDVVSFGNGNFKVSHDYYDTLDVYYAGSESSALGQAFSNNWSNYSNRYSAYVHYDATMPS